MDIRHRTILALNEKILVEETKNVDHIIDILEAKETITSRCANQFRLIEDDRERAQALYDLIPNCGPWAFRSLVEAFQNTGNETLSIILKDNRLSNQSPIEGNSPVDDDFDFFDSKYRMKSSPRGAVLLINVFKYDDDWREQRDGSLKDMQNLRSLFENMGYNVQEGPESGAKREIEDSLIAWKEQPCMSSVDCGIIILMAHGRECVTGSVLIETADKQTIRSEWIISLLTTSEAPRLNGKPKLIFILTCRGKYPDLGTDLDKLQELQDSANRNTQLEANAFDTNGRFEGYAPVSPNLSDVLLIYPCAPGYASVRDPQTGSWFVQEMIAVFRKKAAKDDLETMLKEMDRNLIRQARAGEKVPCYFQVVCTTSRGFQRKLFLNPVSSFSNS